MIENPIFVYVEDDPLSREIMELLIKQALGYPHFTVFADGQTFMDSVADLSPAPNAFFFDIHMQPYDGFSLLKFIREHERFKDACAIALTASVMNEEVDRLKESGFNGLIPKPIDQRSFSTILKQILSGEQIWVVK